MHAHAPTSAPPDPGGGTSRRGGPAPSSLPLLTGRQAASGDEAAVADGATWAGLMERAAGHVARGVVELAGRGYGLRVAIVVGKGNNGGDGWAAARRLRAHGAEAWVVSPYDLEVELSAEAAANRRRWIQTGGRVGGSIEDTLRWCDVAVDALLGTGISGAPRGEAAEGAAALLRAREQDGVAVVACDVPSGVSSDDGSAPEGAVRADLTVTFGALKRGLILHPGAAHAGRVILGELGPHYRPEGPAWRVLTAVGARPDQPATDADKRARGVVQLVAGSVGATGAAILCTRGALGMGAGLTTLATPAHVQRVIAPVVPPAMTRPLAHERQAVSAKAAEQLDLDGVDAVGAGPGLTPGEGTEAVVLRLLADAPRLVLDADALNVFRSQPARLAEHTGDLVLTPHRRELARIGGGDDGPDAWTNRVERVPELAEAYGATVVAKGPGTVVAAPDGRVWVTPTGSSALGTGGTGDVLTGMLTAAIATATDVPLAVARTVWLHGLAGQLAGAWTANRPSSDDLVAALSDALDRVHVLAATQPTWPLDATVVLGADL